MLFHDVFGICFLFLLRKLLQLLDTSQDPVVLAVAVHDIGQYVKHHERGKKYVFLILTSFRY